VGAVLEFSQVPIDDIWKHPEDDEDPGARGAMIRQLAKEFRDEKELQQKRHGENAQVGFDNTRKLDLLGGKMDTVLGDVSELKQEAKSTNGRVKALELKIAANEASVKTIMQLIVPVLLLVLGAWLYKVIGK
jgi:hypothetical protein